MELPSAPAPRRPVLFYNPISGGGKAERFALADEARKRGIEPIELKRGDDLEVLVRGAVERGADGLAMAGGDGSQADRRRGRRREGLPYACIPAGTRNHFALDLGVDRDDVVGALEAFVDGGERRVDLGEVNGRVFVNNVSLGLYAEAVQSAGYRNAKIRTLLDTVPDMLGPSGRELDMRWKVRRSASTAGRRGARLQQPLPARPRGRLGHPPAHHDGLLGITVVGAATGGGKSGGSQQRPWREWSAPTFEVDRRVLFPPASTGRRSSSMRRCTSTSGRSPPRAHRPPAPRRLPFGDGSRERLGGVAEMARIAFGRQRPTAK